MNTMFIKRGINQIVANMTVGKPLCLLILVSLLAYERTRDVGFGVVGGCLFSS